MHVRNPLKVICRALQDPECLLNRKLKARGLKQNSGWASVAAG